MSSESVGRCRSVGWNLNTEWGQRDCEGRGRLFPQVEARWGRMLGVFIFVTDSMESHI